MLITHLLSKYVVNITSEEDKLILERKMELATAGTTVDKIIFILRESKLIVVPMIIRYWYCLLPGFMFLIAYCWQLVCIFFFLA